jgi:DNA recombination protein RmuC
MNTTMLIIFAILAILLIVSLVIAIMSFSKTQANADKMDSYFKAYGELVSNNQRQMAEQQDLRLKAIEESMSRMRSDNSQQLENMRTTVDQNIAKSFEVVGERLEAVSKGLGEMTSVASNVGDLKKILSNVKTRGILGEVQLAGILEQVMSKEQYAENVAPIPGSSNRVEFAIKLPGDGTTPVYLPIDAKFPGDSYATLMDAYETGDKNRISEAKKILFSIMKNEAKDIRQKYIAPPHTTDFAIMFLPIEGLYAEAVNGGMIEELQSKYRVTIAGPTTMAALLNSLQMGFNTLAIERKSHEVWETLGAVKTEFEKFEGVLGDARKKINQADQELEKLIGTRTNAINRKLRNVTALEGEESSKNLLGIINRD